MPARIIARGTSRCGLTISSPAPFCSSNPTQLKINTGRTAPKIPTQLLEGIKSAKVRCAPVECPPKKKKSDKTTNTAMSANLAYEPKTDSHFPTRRDRKADQVTPQMKMSATTILKIELVRTLPPIWAFGSPKKNVAMA